MGLSIISDVATEDEATPDEATPDEPGQNTPLVPITILADVNGDGRVSIIDVTCVQKHLAGGYKNTGKVGTPVYTNFPPVPPQ